jgi:hypothetical protein
MTQPPTAKHLASWRNRIRFQQVFVIHLPDAMASILTLQAASEMIGGGYVAVDSADARDALDYNLGRLSLGAAPHLAPKRHHTVGDGGFDILVR